MTSPSNRDARVDHESVGDDGPDAGNRGGALGLLAAVSGGVAAVAGVGGALWMLGAFGPVSCWTSRATTDSGTTTVERGCSAGIDYLFGAGGNAPVLFFWSVALLALVGVGAASAWTGRTWATWATAVACAVVTVVGAFSIGSFFLVPAVALLTAAVARTVAARRERATTR